MWRQHVGVLGLFVAVLALGAALYREAMRLTAVEVRIAAIETSRVSTVRQPVGTTNPVGHEMSLAGSSLTGSQSADVAVIEYTDFQCPFCAKFAIDTLPTIEREYVATGRVLFALKQLPLTRIHPFAEKAAEAALCARDQGQFWQMHGLLFHASPALPDAVLLQQGDALKLTVHFRVCLAAGKAVSQIQSDAAEAVRFGITGTPTFLFGRLEGNVVTISNKVSGARDIAEFRSILNALLTDLRLP